MAKTNKELRSDFAKQMLDKRRERNEQINQINKLPISDELKEQNRKAIMENFEKQVDEMKNDHWYMESKKTYVEEKEAKNRVAKSKKAKEALIKEYEEKLAKADADITESEKQYEEAQLLHRWKVEKESGLENPEIPDDLKNYRKAWENAMFSISEENKEKIIKTVDKISVKIDEDLDGSRLVEFKLGDKMYKILDPKLENHTDGEYRHRVSYNSITEVNRDAVKFNWMRWDNVDDWENQKLKEYVKEKQGEWLHIPEIWEMWDLLEELWKKAGLDSRGDQIAMLMYLSGMDWTYWLGNAFGGARGYIDCHVAGGSRDIADTRYDHSASLCMISSN